MKNLSKILIMSLIILGITSCGNKEEVPQGYVGKIITEKGLNPEILQPGVYNLGFSLHNKLILLQTSEEQFIEDVTIRMKDNMDLKVDYIRIRIKVNKKNKILNSLFNDIPANNDNIITLKKMYNTYGNLIVIRDMREVLSKYTLDDVRLNYSKVVGEVYEKIQADFKSTPLLLLDINIGRFNYPKIYSIAILQSKKKELEIKKAQAEAAIKIEKTKAKIKIAKAEYLVKMQEAKRIADYNKLIGNSITDKLIQLRRLEVQQKIAENLANNKNVVYMPLPMMGSTSMFIGNSKK